MDMTFVLPKLYDEGRWEQTAMDMAHTEND